MIQSAAMDFRAKWWKGVQNGQYAPVEMEEGKQQSEAPLEDAAIVSKAPSLLVSLETLTRIVCVLMFLAGAGMMWTSRTTTTKTRKYGSDLPKKEAECTKLLSLWSPVLPSVRYEVRDFKESTSNNTIYDGPPSASLEAAWKTLETMPAVMIPDENLILLDRSHIQGFVEAKREGGGIGYVGTVEVFHHLHCLNVVRQYVQRDEYPDGLVPWLFKSNSKQVARDHVTHCIATLREALMCNADLTPYLWFKGKVGEVAKEDFGASHKCKNWDSIVEGVKKHAVDIPKSAFQPGKEHEHSK
ncbi:hypothetical protein BLS_009706 [Venturia inaequalis]|uniref:Tat pathway signal sequence n=2 Tax=Venturia inaequalis TaxID=5025 RepID=A0A8H3U4Q8_VENIN|nr:hypothetical protein BLS_009706 [Venturia inaequalis]RDI78991.1 Spindle pole body component [Venturia inaequalis]